MTLLAGFREALVPCGLLEEVLVEMAAAAYWRMRRVLRAEVGDIRLSLISLPSATEARTATLRILQDKLAELGDASSDRLDDGAAWRDAEATRRGMPSLEMLDRIVSYEALLQREFYRALRSLERLQRMRAGEMVPPPVDIEVRREV